ncbi:hypothetical protein AVEN_60288-1 [Araneus ventricosus]|uniref:DDE-1 domain-containing protein n=1 Tax=Araneus ventricosus TaxID=182803 RepID=A0A4Y2CYU9_ARAVE|nr:hypothetical protein AVEN_60288-1 [Araneus ventricosus]
MALYAAFGPRILPLRSVADFRTGARGVCLMSRDPGGFKIYSNCIAVLRRRQEKELCTDGGEISARFLPSNTTALIQPMGQNVIQNVKLGYRKLLLTNILNDPVHNEKLEKTLKNVNLKDVVFSLANCWASISILLINNWWKNLRPNFIDSEVEEIQLASLINQLQNTNPMSNTETLQWAADTDDSLARNEILTNDEIIRTVTAEDDDDERHHPCKPRQNFSF